MFDTLFEHSPSATFVVDGGGVVTLANPAVRRMLGYEDVVGLTLSTLFVDAEAFDDARSACGVRDLELEVTHANNTTFVVAMCTFPTSSQDGCFVVLTDQSDRERAQRQLEHSQTLNKTGTWSLDLRTDVVWWSPELFRIFELPVADEAPPYETHHQLFSAESWERLQVAVSAAFEGEPYEIELELARHDEEGPLLAIARCEPQLGEDGSVIRLIGTFHDVTELMRTRRQSDTMLARLTIAKTMSGLGIWEWNPQTNELIWDERMYELYGIPVGPVVYEHWRGAVHPEDLDEAERSLREVLEGKPLSHRQFRVVVEGGVRHIMSLASRVRDGDTGRTRMIGVNMDVTEQVRHQDELRRTNNLQSLGLLAGGIAHDFNNLLTGIMAHAELLRFTNEGAPEVTEVVDAISQAVESASTLTQQLLTFSKGGAPIRRMVSLEELVREQVTFSLRGSSTCFELTTGSNLWAAEVDPGQMSQVVQNLVLNADQAMPRGGEISVHLQNRYPEQPGDPCMIELRVTDTGHGMPEEVCQQVFLPYFSTKIEGHGLGLSICHSIVERHGGSIRVESVVGEGTTFVIELPASVGGMGEGDSEPMTHKGEGRILIVDDQDDVRVALMMLIERLGFDTVGASDVNEAVDLVRAEYGVRGSFDLVLTDLTMPGSQGGLDVVRRIKRIDPGACIVVLTGYADDPVLRDFRDHGFDAALTKPVGAAELSKTLNALVGVRRGDGGS